MLLLTVHILGLPIPIVAISAGLSYEKYQIKNEDGERIAYVIK